MRQLLYCTILFLLAAGAAAQDISGTWTGNFNHSFLTAKPEKIVVEIFLQDDSLISGASHLYYRHNWYEHYTIKGIYHQAAAQVVFTEDSTIGIHLPVGNCLGQYTMTLSAADTLLSLDGQWVTRPQDEEECPVSGVWLKRSLKKKTTPDQGLTRSVNIQQLFEIGEDDKDSIRIELLDNEEIDGDVISLYVNDSLLLHHLAINATAKVFYLSLSKARPISRILMVAESQGSTPPCTALMRVHTHSKDYEVSLSSNFSSNGVVELFLKE